MDQKHIQNEMRYRLLMIVLSTMLADGIIHENEYATIRKNLLNKLKPLVGQLEE